MNRETFKLIASIVPLVAFFLAYKFLGIIPATLTLVVSSCLALLAEYLYLKEKPSTASLLSCVALVFFGSMTYFMQDATYIKMKPTVIYLIFAAILFFSSATSKNLAAKLMSKISPDLKLSAKKLDMYCGFSFVICALSNEFVWRNFEESTWINFKIFILPIMIFIMVGLSAFLSAKRNLKSRNV